MYIDNIFIKNYYTLIGINFSTELKKHRLKKIDPLFYIGSNVGGILIFLTKLNGDYIKM